MLSRVRVAFRITNGALNLLCLLALVWDIRRNVQLPVCELRNIDEFVSSMITDSNSRLLLCTSGEGTLTAYNTRARKMEAQVTVNVTLLEDVTLTDLLQSEVYPSEMNCLAMIRQDTKVLTGLGNGNMYIFDWNAFGYHSDSFGDNPAGVNCMLPITDNIVIIGCDDGKIRAINVFPHRYIGVVGQHKFPVERIDISTCGRYIATSSHDGRVRFWNISYFENPEIVQQAPAKKSVRNKKKSLRKEKLGFQLPSSKKRNKSDFFAGLADPEPEEAAEEDSDASDTSDPDSD